FWLRIPESREFPGHSPRLEAAGGFKMPAIKHRGGLMRSLAVRVTPISIAVVTMLALAAVPAGAQAFLPAQGEGTVSVVFQDFSIIYHFLRSTAGDRRH